MTRWTWLLAGVVVLAALAGLAASRALGRPGSRPGAALSVATGWLGAWVLWGLAGTLAVRAGLLDRYDGSLFAVLALGGGLWQYRTHVAEGRERGLVLFVAGQLLWLGVVLARNGLLLP
ncbi:MAG TPA: hypothetical protein VNN07_09845 [Candidatus Tectomicrobia bacterium]|nr:hypothetical protein [Candidatus Tectomicrobia bacterium]